MRRKVLMIVIMAVLLSFPGTVRAEAPTLVVSSIIVSPPIVMVGSVFQAEMVVVNTGAAKALTVALSMNLPSMSVAYFSVVGSGTVLDIGELAVGGNATVRASIAVSYQATAGTYDFPYTLTYSDENNYSYNNTGAFGVTIEGIPDIEVQSVTLDPARLTPTTDGTLTISLVNTGTDDAQGVTVRVYGDTGLLTGTVAYLGLLARGAEDSIVLGIHVDSNAAAGTWLTNITLSWRDSYGNSYANWRTYDLRVYPSDPLIPTYDIALIAGAIVFILAAYIVFRRLK